MGTLISKLTAALQISTGTCSTITDLDFEVNGKNRPPLALVDFVCKLLANRSRAKLALGNAHGANKDASRIIELMPNRFRGHQRFAEALASEFHVNPAIEAYEEAARSVPACGV